MVPVSAPAQGREDHVMWLSMAEYLALLSFAAEVTLTLKHEPFRGFTEFAT